MPIAKPTDAELEILHILWEQGPSTVRTVNDLLNERRKNGLAATRSLEGIALTKPGTPMCAPFKAASAEP